MSGIRRIPRLAAFQVKVSGVSYNVACGLLYAAAKQSDHGSNIANFDFAVTFEEIRSAFPTIALPHGA